MHSGNKLPIIVLFSALVLCMAVTSWGQEIRFEDFSSLANLNLNGNAHQALYQGKEVLRLTDGPVAFPNNPQTASTYFTVQQPLTMGFTTYFKFQMHNPTACCTPGDGLAFVIQNDTDGTDGFCGASGSGLTALGAGNGGIAYTGVKNSLAVEFDIFANSWDPNPNHVAIQSCGSSANSPVHEEGSFPLCQNHQVTSCLLNQSQNSINETIPMLGGACSRGVCSDGPVHQVVIDYEPGNGDQSGTLMVWLDPQFIQGTHTPVPGAPTVLNVPYDITSLNLTNGTSAWVGFTASQPDLGTAQDLMAWEFTPHGNSSIQQQIPPGGTPAIFNFGDHEFVVTYPLGFQNPLGIRMTVEAKPTPQNVFQQRLVGTAFADEGCIIYLSTGGNCIVYTVTCQDANNHSVTCPTEPTNSIDIDTGYLTTQHLTGTNTNFLKAPGGTNNWISIFTGFEEDGFGDPVTSGRGNSFSDIVATFIRNRN